MSFLDKPQKAVQCRACDIMFVCDDDDMQSIFCGDEGCPGIEKSQVDKQKLREWLSTRLIILQKSCDKYIELEHDDVDDARSRGMELDSFRQKLDAGEFDAKD